MPTQTNLELKDRVRQYRMQRRLTQKDLAARMKVNVRTIKRLEAGHQMAEQTVYDVEQLLGRETA